MMLVAIVSALCLVAGLTLGLLGGGGSILAVPILVYAGGLETRAAIATSLLVVGVSSAIAALAHGVRGGVDVRAGLMLGVASMVGAYAGGRLGQHLPSAALLAAFTAVMFVTALAMMRRRPEPEEGRPAASWIKISMVGLGVGLLTGLVGAGGGFIVVPALTLLCGITIRRAVGTSLFVIAMNSVAGFAGSASGVSIDPVLATAATVAAASGSLVGVAISARLAAQTLRGAFAWLVLGMSLFMAVKQLPADALSRAREAAPYILVALVGAALAGATCLLVRLRRSAPLRARQVAPGR